MLHSGHVDVESDLMGSRGETLGRTGEINFDWDFFGKIGEGLFTIGDSGLTSDLFTRKDEIDVWIFFAVEIDSKLDAITLEF